MKDLLVLRAVYRWWPDGSYVGVQQTQDELEVRLLSGDERHDGGGVVVDANWLALEMDLRWSNNSLCGFADGQCGGCQESHD